MVARRRCESKGSFRHRLTTLQRTGPSRFAAVAGYEPEIRAAILLGQLQAFAALVLSVTLYALRYYARPGSRPGPDDRPNPENYEIFG